MKREVIAGLLVLGALSGVRTALAADPVYRLESGDSVTVNPETKRATITRDGVTIPLYDGTHRTEDGNVLIIRQGVTTIPRDIPSPREPEKSPAELWEGAPIIGYSPCERLVRKVCGVQSQCADRESCVLARQLLGMESQERAATENRNRMTFSSGQCIEATPDTELFPACDRH